MKRYRLTLDSDGIYAIAHNKKFIRSSKNSAKIFNDTYNAGIAVRLVVKSRERTFKVLDIANSEEELRERNIELCI